MDDLSTQLVFKKMMCVYACVHLCVTESERERKKGGRKEERKRERYLSSTGSLPKRPQQPVLNQAEAKSFIRVSHVGGRGSAI